MGIWNFRSISEPLPSYTAELYAAYPEMFTIKLHHQGYFTDPPRRHYFRGLEIYVEPLDVDDLSMQLLHQIMKELEYVNPNYYKLYFKRPNCDLDAGLVELTTDEDVAHIRQYVESQEPVIEVYMVKVEFNTSTSVSPEYTRIRRQSNQESSCSRRLF